MLILVGSNHKSAPVELRERMAVEPDQLRPALERLLEQEGVREGMILSTCNRVEVLVLSGEGEGRGVEAVHRFLESERGISDAELRRHTYHYAGNEAVQHLFRVACGLDSMILGEPQILGQVRQAYLAASRHGATGAVLERLLQHALGTAKKVRTETGISRHPVSVAYAAVELAGRIFGNLNGRTALLLGSGKMADLVARHLLSKGVESLTVASRTFNHAVAAAERFGGTAVHWEDGLGRVGRVDIVVSCTAAPQHVLSKSDVVGALRGRRRGPLFIIDIAVPRDVDPAVNDLDRVYLYDIDALEGLIESNLEERRRAAKLAHRLVADEVASFERWRQAQEITPTIVSLREALLGVGQVEVERFRGKLGTLTPAQQAAVEQLTRGVIQKILHRPIRRLRAAVERGDVSQCTALYHEIFGLDQVEEEKRERDETSGGDGEGRKGPQRLLRGGKEE
jgi:glutamyl-tRNA reductase